jgi:hypothetical protein
LSSSRRNTILGTSLAVLSIIAAFLAGMYLMHPAADTVRTVTNDQYSGAATTQTIFVTSTGTAFVTSTLSKTDVIVNTVTTTLTSNLSTDSCSQSVSLPTGSYTNTQNVHVLINSCASKAVVQVGPTHNPDEYTITCNSSCSVILENMAVNTYYVSVSLNGSVYTGQFVVTSSA